MGGQGSVGNDAGAGAASRTTHAQGRRAVVAAGVVAIHASDDVVLARDVDLRRVGAGGVGLDGLGEAENLLRVDQRHFSLLLGGRMPGYRWFRPPVLIHDVPRRVVYEDQGRRSGHLR